MFDFELGYVPDPLTDKFSLADLPRIAPWVFDEITAIGVDEVKHTIADLGEDPDEPHSMPMWVSAMSRSHGELWSALAQG